MSSETSPTFKKTLRVFSIFDKVPDEEGKKVPAFRSRYFFIFQICLAAFFSLVTCPSSPLYEEVAESSLSLLGGLLVGLPFISMGITAPIFIKISNISGRKFVMLLSMIMFGFLTIFFSYFEHSAIHIIGRLLIGATAGGAIIPVVWMIENGRHRDAHLHMGRLEGWLLFGLAMPISGKQYIRNWDGGYKIVAVLSAIVTMLYTVGAFVITNDRYMAKRIKHGLPKVAPSHPVSLSWKPFAAVFGAVQATIAFSVYTVFGYQQADPWVHMYACVAIMVGGPLLGYIYPPIHRSLKLQKKPALSLGLGVTAFFLSAVFLGHGKGESFGVVVAALLAVGSVVVGTHLGVEVAGAPKALRAAWVSAVWSWRLVGLGVGAVIGVSAGPTADNLSSIICMVMVAVLALASVSAISNAPEKIKK
eukprot:gnl/Dysnectes_brevis/740_a813_2949.p1 GENE.gnl/Dysnectes_brevis/740_a813_2949~~gnl/Dysnectes_brevis/740_a813_2949.p1  ORF type:complete len:418 (+),score=144.86 gnl/Dysnectes_brevis/740_a813_2949:888-2141(+)